MPKPPVYCCIPIEFIQPWDQNQAIRQVKELGLGNMVLIQGTAHVGNSESDRARWKREYPHLAARIDAVPHFPDRPAHGMAVLFDLTLDFRLAQLALCRELGLLNFAWALVGPDLSADERRRLREAGAGVTFAESFMGENLSMLGGTYSLHGLKQIAATPMVGQSESYFIQPGKLTGDTIFDRPAGLDFQSVHDWVIDRFRTHGQALRKTTKAPLLAIEASVQMRLALEAGADLPIFELVPHEPLGGLAATRGAAKAYDKEIWGIHAAMGYYRAPSDLWTPERLRIAYDLFYAGGASFFSEPNMALRNWGSCSGFFTIPASPPIRWAEQECRGFDDPICVRSREVLADHYRFTQFHDRPSKSGGSGPRVAMGYLLGHLDGWCGQEQTMWMVDPAEVPGFAARDALAMWRHFGRAFDSEPWYIPPRKYYWQADPAKPLRHGTPPCGQVDLVPSEAPPEVMEKYGCLALLGWNTMTPEVYAKLLHYVQKGGTLFLSVPHLSTRTRTDRPQEIISGGDVRDLCGLRVLGPGERVEEVLVTQQSAGGRHVFPRGTLYLEEIGLAKVELHGAWPLAVSRDKGAQPVLLEHAVGKGRVFLLAAWDYPGHRLDAFITDILRTLAEAEQGDIAVEGAGVYYAVYDGRTPSGLDHAVVYLVNHDMYGRPAYPTLIVGGGERGRWPVRVDGKQMRIAWVFDGLVISPHDRFVKVADASREGGAWTIALESIPRLAGTDGGGDSATADDGHREVQVEATGRLRSVTLDGVPLDRQHGREGDVSVRCRLKARSTLRVEVA